MTVTAAPLVPCAACYVLLDPASAEPVPSQPGTQRQALHALAACGDYEAGAETGGSGEQAA